MSDLLEGIWEAQDPSSNERDEDVGKHLDLAVRPFIVHPLHLPPGDQSSAINASPAVDYYLSEPIQDISTFSFQCNNH